ncbi:hypothetical protein B5X24_HaOG205906 [Helicoverpa armigera]|uniref:Reverse transcriptase zinc-binding domain-containing protein n=1 Tax=Helicoverpa armigera TaxID=29058 RepID=A0A2W1BS98_HELAM|nr:hypothetical protein B5X24_HaOG205906 [Helicoverpa armigera]
MSSSSSPQPFPNYIGVGFQSHWMQPSTGVLRHASIVAVSPLFEEWLLRSHGAVTYRTTHDGHGCFGRYLHRIGRQEASGCHQCADSPEDTVDHTVQECPAWEGHRWVLVEALGDGDLTRPALVQAI